MADTKSATAVEFWRRITDDLFKLNLITSATESRHVYLSNFVRETVAHLYGKGITKSEPIEVTAAGEMKVAVTGAGLQGYDSNEATAADDLAISIAFSTITSSLNINVDAQDALVRLSIDGAVFGEWFTVKAGETLDKDITVHTMEIKNASAGLDHEHRIIGWF